MVVAGLHLRSHSFPPGRGLARPSRPRARSRSSAARRSRPRGCASTPGRSDRDVRRRVEAAPVVADLDEDLLPPEPRPGPARRLPRRASGHSRAPPARWRTAASPRAARRQPRRGSPDVDGQPLRSAQPGGVSGECRNQPVVDRVAAQLEDERANLALHAPREVRDRAERSSDRALTGCRPPAPGPSGPCVCSTVENSA